MTNFNPTQYQYKSSNDYGEFSYYWAFCSYDIGDSYVKLVLNIDLEGYTEDDIANFKNYADYPKLAKILEDIVVDYEGQILTDNPASFGFAFEHKKDMFDFISDVAKRMRWEPAFIRHKRFQQRRWVCDQRTGDHQTTDRKGHYRKRISPCRRQKMQIIDNQEYTTGLRRAILSAAKSYAFGRPYVSFRPPKAILCRRQKYKTEKTHDQTVQTRP